MKFDEIPENIKDGGNIYENEQEIKTLKVKEWTRINEQRAERCIKSWAEGDNPYIPLPFTRAGLESLTCLSR